MWIRSVSFVGIVLFILLHFQLPSIFSLFLCVSCLLFVSVLITCFFFLFTFCKHCMQKKCYDLRSLLCCKLHHTTSFPFISLFPTNRASLQPTDRKFEKVFLDERHCVDEGFVASRPAWNLMERKRLHTPIIWLWGKIPNWWWVVLKKIEVHAWNLYFQHVFSSATLSSQ